MKIFIDIDNTIFHTIGNKYAESKPNYYNINKANKLDMIGILFVSCFLQN